MRVEQIGDATLYQGDCRDIIPTLGPIDSVVSDPPYGTDGITTDGRGYGRRQNHLNNETIILNDKNLDCCFEAINLVSTRYNNFRMLVFYSCRLTDEFFSKAGLFGVYKGEIIWDKKAPGLGLGNNIRYQHENIAVFEKGEPPPMTDSVISVITDMRTPILHPHQKPPTLMQHLCKVAGGETILDMFMGSGSTGVAALTLRKKFIGIELDERHFETACRRITEASKQDGLF